MNTNRYSTPEDIRAVAVQFQQSRILLSAYELGIFTSLGSGSKTSTQVAQAIQANARATDRLMNALVAMDLLEKNNGKFSNSSAAQRFLVQSSPDYLAGLMHTVHLWDTWSNLTESVREGTAVAVRRRINDRGKNWLEAFIGAMHDRAKKQAPAIAHEMNLSGVKRVLDVGGGPGTFAMAFVHASDEITATVFDLPNVIPLTKQYVRQAGLSKRIDTVAGDYLSDNLPRGYDLVFLSAVIHSNSPTENKKLIGKCARSLNTGGRVVVQDFIMDEDRTSPPHGAFFALNMLVGTDHGDTYTESDVVSWMKAAGLSNISRHDTRFAATQIIGRKI
jgi:predicted O-methyltransferase YrrM